MGVRWTVYAKGSQRCIKKMPTGDPFMPEDVRRTKHIRHKMSERADLGVGEKATAEKFFPDDTVSTIASIMSYPDAIDDGGGASTLSVATLPMTPGNESDAASAEAADSEERRPRPLVNPRVESFETRRE